MNRTLTALAGVFAACGIPCNLSCRTSHRDAQTTRAESPQAADGPLARTVTVLTAGTSAGGQTPCSRMVVGIGSVYCWSSETRRIVKIPTSGGEPTVLGGADEPTPLVLVDSMIYWSEDDRSVNGASIAGGPSHAIVRDAFIYGFCGGVAVDRTGIFWTDEGVFGLPGGSIMRSTLDGRDVRTFASEQNGPTEIAVDTASVYWIDSHAAGRYRGGGPILPMPEDAAPPPPPIGEIMKLDKHGGSPATLASGQVEPGSLVVKGGDVYWISHRPSHIMRAPASGAQAVAVIEAGDPFALAVDDDNIYWADASAGLVMKATRVGGSPTILAKNQGRLAQIAVDKASVYWTTSDGSLARATPK